MEIGSSSRFWREVEVHVKALLPVVPDTTVTLRLLDEVLCVV